MWGRFLKTVSLPSYQRSTVLYTSCYHFVRVHLFAIRFHVSSELVCIITVCTYFPLTYKNVPHSKPAYRCSLPQFASILAREIVRVEDIFLHLEMRSLNLNDMDCHHM